MRIALVAVECTRVGRCHRVLFLHICIDAEFAMRDNWTYWGWNPGPSACEAGVIPLHHVPHEDAASYHVMLTQAGPLFKQGGNKHPCPVSGHCSIIATRILYEQTNCMVKHSDFRSRCGPRNNPMQDAVPCSKLFPRLQITMWVAKGFNLACGHW